MTPSQTSHVAASTTDAAIAKAELRKFYVIYGAIFLCSLAGLAVGYLIEELHVLPGLKNHLWLETETLSFLNKLAAHLFDEAGIAGLIACGLAVTIERFSTKEFTKHARKLAEEEREAIKHDVFFSVLGHFVPKEIMAEMTSQILVETFVRRNVFMTYTLSPFNDLATHSMYVVVDFELQYDIINLSSYRRPFIVKSGFSKPPIPSLADQAKFLCVSALGCENPFTLNEAEILIHPETGSHISLNCKEPLWVKPGLDNFATVTIRSRTVKHFAGGSSYFTVEYHTADLELAVHVYDRTLDVYSGASPVSADIEWLKETPRHKPAYGYYNWKLQRPLLAFQSVYLTWNPKELVKLSLPANQVETQARGVHAPAPGAPPPQIPMSHKLLPENTR